MATVGHQVLCCTCGVLMPANPANMCLDCIKSRVDITEGIPKQIPVSWCKGCQRFLHTNNWIAPAPESRELLAMLVKKVRGLNRVRLVDAGFVWTEPHSKRLKIKLTIQKEVLNGVLLQQVFVVEFVMQNLYCPDCHKAQAANTWSALVQVRQRVGHKRTVYFLEQLILKHGAHSHVNSLKEAPDGLDFFFGNTSHARRFVDFVTSVCPCKVDHSKKLVAQDLQSNISTYKNTWFIEIVPICRGDLVCLPRRLAGSMGIGQLVLCERITGTIRLMDPFTLTRTDLSATQFWASPFRPLCDASALTEYTLLDVNVVGARPWEQEAQKAQASRAGLLADITLVRTSDLGSNDMTYSTRTHLGGLLHPGDIVLGFDVASANTNDEAADMLRAASRLPDVVLVRKGYQKRHRRRIWALQQIERAGGAAGAGDEEGEEERKSSKRVEDAAQQQRRDMEHLMRDLEEDPELRKEVNLYKAADAAEIMAIRDSRKEEMRDVAEDQEQEQEDASGDEEPAFPDVQLDELVEAVGSLTIKPGGNAVPSEDDEELEDA